MKNYFIITGTSRGIGKALAEELLLNSKNKVLGLSRNNIIKHQNFSPIKMDLSHLQMVEQFQFPDFKDAHKIFLINNAGTLGSIKHIGHLKTESIINSFNVNLTAVALLCNSFIQKYQNETMERVIINISSGAAKSAYDGWATYCATKAGLNMLTEVIYKEQCLKKLPIKVFGVAPGVVDTNMQDLIRASDKKHFNNIQKFKDLKQQEMLYPAREVAKKFVSMFENTSEIKKIISRIEL